MAYQFFKPNSLARLSTPLTHTPCGKTPGGRKVCVQIMMLHATKRPRLLQQDSLHWIPIGKACGSESRYPASWWPSTFAFTLDKHNYMTLWSWFPDVSAERAADPSKVRWLDTNRHVAWNSRYPASCWPSTFALPLDNTTWLCGAGFQMSLRKEPPAT